MGVIQQGINQLIGTAAIAARLSPDYEANQKIKEAEAIKKRVIEQSQTLASEESDVAKRIIKQEQLGIPQQLAEQNKTLASYGAASPSLAAESVKQAKINTAVAKGIEQKKLKIVPLDAKGFQRAQQKAAEQLKQKEKFSNFRKQISSDVQDTLNIMQGKDVPTQAELDLDKQILKVLPNFNDFGENAKQQIREQFKEGGKK